MILIKTRISINLVFVITIVSLKCNASNVMRTPSRGANNNNRVNADGFIFPADLDSDNNNNRYSKNSHQHLHDQGHSYANQGNNDISLIPLDLIKKFNNYTEVNDLLLYLVEGDIDDRTLENRFGDVERSRSVTPKAAVCMPELQTVKIINEDVDPSILYIPSCTRVERCGGCCSSSLLSCQPQDSEIINYMVVKTQFMGGSKLKYMGKEIVQVEKHLKCKCDCTIKESDCNNFQVYKKSDCRCVCMNSDEEKKCNKENATKIWNHKICACECRNLVPCSTGYVFDHLQCRCIQVLIRRRYADAQVKDTTIYKNEDLPIEPSLYEIKNLKT